MLGHKELPISPMKKLKILSENQNIHNKSNGESAGEFVTKYDTNSQNDLKIKMSNLKPQEQIEESSTKEVDEPLLQESVGQYVIFPINHDDMWASYKKLVENFWSTTDSIEHLEELDLSPKETQFLKKICSFFATLDSNSGIVNENFAEDFSKLIQVTEAKFYYGHQLFVQNIHFETYNKLFETLCNNDEERDKFLKETETLPSVRAKREWVKKWTAANVSFSDKLVASICVHGLFFCTVLIIQQWMKIRSMQKNYNHEFFTIVDKMVIDQEYHRDFGCLMISHLKNKPSSEFVLKMIEEATQIEKAFLYEAVPFVLLDLTIKDVNQILDKQSALLRILSKQALDSVPKVKSVASEKELATSSSSASASVTDNKNVKKEEDRNIRFDEDF